MLFNSNYNPNGQKIQIEVNDKNMLSMKWKKTISNSTGKQMYYNAEINGLLSSNFAAWSEVMKPFTAIVSFKFWNHSS